MKFVIQRVKSASVSVDDEVVGKIDNGFLVLIGIAKDDTKEIADRLIKKLIGLRIFSDSDDKINLSLDSVNGSLLLVSQFTLYADCKKGNRPSFVNAAGAAEANDMYEYIIAKARESVANVQTGIFGASMEVSLVNDGPFTIIFDSQEM